MFKLLVEAVVVGVMVVIVGSAVGYVVGRVNSVDSVSYTHLRAHET